MASSIDTARGVHGYFTPPTKPMSLKEDFPSEPLPPPADDAHDEAARIEDDPKVPTSDSWYSRMTVGTVTEEIEQLLALNFFGICGTLGRNGLITLLWFENLGSVWANVTACFVIALVPGLFGPTLSGIVGTGFCGSMSTFSELVTDIFTESTTPKPSWPDAGYGVPLFMGRLILEMSCCFASYLAGSHCVLMLKHFGYQKLEKNHELLIRRVCEVVGIAAWVVCLVTTITSPNHLRWWPLGGVIAPTGVWLRFYLSKLNKEKKWFKWGTFHANFIGTIVACVCVVCLKLPSLTPLQEQMVLGVQKGFAGCLSTISTFVKELNTMRLPYAYLYGIITLFIGYSLSFIIIGSYVWTR